MEYSVLNCYKCIGVQNCREQSSSPGHETLRLAHDFAAAPIRYGDETRAAKAAAAFSARSKPLMSCVGGGKTFCQGGRNLWGGGSAAGNPSISFSLSSSEHATFARIHVSISSSSVGLDFGQSRCDTPSGSHRKHQSLELRSSGSAARRSPTARGRIRREYSQHHRNH